MDKLIDIKRHITGEEDESGAGGLWDLAAELTMIVRRNIIENTPYIDDCFITKHHLPLTPSECGQEDVYNKLLKYTKE